MSSEEQQLLAEFDAKVRRRPRFLGRVVECLPRVTRITGPTSDQLDNLIFWSDLDTSTADEEIRHQIAYFADLEHNFEWIVYGHDQPEHLPDLLLAQGFALESTEKVVVAASGSIHSPPLPAGIELKRVRDEEGVSEMLSVQTQIWGRQHEGFIRRWLNDMVRDHPEECILLAAYAEGEPVAASWATAWKNRPFAPLFGGSVLPDWRGQGIYRAMVATRAQAIRNLGIPWCMVDAGEMSFPILKHLGFRSLTTRTSLRWNPA